MRETRAASQATGDGGHGSGGEIRGQGVPSFTLPPGREKD